jgi:hypothetical protein
VNARGKALAVLVRMAKQDPRGCHRLAEEGLSFCGFHCAAVFGMARGALSPDERTRSLFEQVWDSLDDEDQHVPR